jgi:hypothetical protein
LVGVRHEIQMIQGVHGSSVVFAEFRAVSGDLVAKVSRSLPGIEGAGYPVRLRGAAFRVRLGPVHKEKRDVVAALRLESSRVPFEPQLVGLLTLREDATGSRTKISFEGKCSRTFDGFSSAASTEALVHHANGFCRTLLDLLAMAVEGSPSDASVRVDLKKSSTSGRRSAARHGTKAAISGPG